MTYIEKTGWVRTSRFGKKVGFIHIYDGLSTFNKYGDTQAPKDTQIVVTDALLESSRNIGIGSAIKVCGEFVESIGPDQSHEIQATSIEILGKCDPSVYPIQKKDTSPEFLRTIPHLRARTQAFQNLFRIRSKLSSKIHHFFQTREFEWIHTPILTPSDCEGAGEVFKATSKDDFFDKEMYLTVSGQLDLEAFAAAFSKVYTFGPTFRAENSNTARHANEFWMVEAEIAFSKLDDIILLAGDFVREVGFTTMVSHADAFLGLEIFKDNEDFLDLKKTVVGDYDRVTYKEAQEILVKSGKDFAHPIGYGEHIQTEHEKFLATEYFKKPTFITHYPADHKAFYMKLSPDGETVESFDLIVPEIGEIIGGSQREDDLIKLENQIEKRKINPEFLGQYLDLRKYGTNPHGGFGMGLERMLMWITKTQNIRDVIPFPRTPGTIY